jgi:membrane fusion protein, heavy metal efflux system
MYQSFKVTIRSGSKETEPLALPRVVDVRESPKPLNVHENTQKRIWCCLLAAFALIGTDWVGRAEAQSPPRSIAISIDAASEAARNIRIVPARRTGTARKITATASVEANADAVAQISTRIPARVMKLIAEPGQSVTPGQPLAILSSIELGDAKAEYLKARSLLSIADQNLRREQQLYAKEISSLKDVLTARAAYDTELAQFQAARERLTLLIPPDELAHLKWSSNSRPLSEFPLTSPIVGTLVRRDLLAGEAVASDRSLMTVINLDKVWVDTNLFESDVAAVRIGDPATVSVVAYPDRAFEGQVFYIGNEVDRKTRTVLARIEVPNLDDLLKPGMFARAVIEGSSDSREALIVPDSAVFDYQGSKIVFVAAGANRYEERPVQVGGQSQGGAEILSGLSGGEQVVVSGGLALKGLLLKQSSE